MTTNLRPAVRLTAAVCCLIAIVLASPPSVEAQDTELRKSDVVRLLSGSTYSVVEVATIIRTNCLSFEPTERDYADFRDLGADASVISAIQGCVEGVVAAPEPQALPSVDVQPEADTVVAAAGEEAQITIVVRLGGQVASGVQVVLRGRPQADGTVPRWAARSGPDGRAIVRVPAGTGIRNYPLVVDVAGARLTGRRAVTLVTTAAAPSGLFEPVGSVAVDGGALDLGIGVQDDFGNPVSGLAITVVRPSDEVVVARGTTGADGRTSASVATSLIAGEQALHVRSEVGPVGMIALEGDARPAAVTFVAGMAQVALPDRRLAEPIVVVVTDGAGDPVAGTLVVFDVSNGQPDDPAGRTDTGGRTVMRLTAGTVDSEPVGIRAVAGSASGTLDIPVRTRAQLAAEAMARADRFVAVGNTRGAIAEYGEVVDFDPESLEAWIGLGRAWAAAGEREEALFAFDQALLIDPQSVEALQGRSANTPRRTVFELDVWGGKTDDNDRDAGIRNAEVRVHATENVEVHFTFDNALNLRHPYLTRGDADLKGFYGGVGLRWGAERQFTSSFEFGKRESPPIVVGSIGTNQNSFTFTQDVRTRGGSGVSFGGWYGRWFDQDDWSVFAEGRFVAGSAVAVIPSVSYGDHAGSNVISLVESTRRAKEKELRGGIRLRYESPSGWGIEPGVAVGSVTSDTPVLDGSLFDATARVWASLGQARIQGYVRRQSPPGTPSFWTFAIGLGFSVQEQ
jgi:hypothetical protein